MKSQKVINSLKNAMGTVMLLAGAFFVCSTLVSIRAVFADPIAPVDTSVYMGPQSGRTNARASGRTSPRNNAATTRQTVARTAVVPGAVNTTSARSVNANSARAVANRANASRVNAAPSRNVVSRATNVANRANAARNVRARTAVAPSEVSARVSLQGSAIRGNTGTNAVTSYSYLTNKLYAGNYSNIIDSTTGLISDDAYQNCLESYYTCMDEICTARNAAQRRCACAGRVTSFAAAEAALEAANEELIKASGELALLIATKGEDVSSAFQLTDAEKVMNCVSWREASQNGKSDENFGDWCVEHGIYDDGKCSHTVAPEYCNKENNGFGFDVNDLNGSGSDILATIRSWSDAINETKTIGTDDDQGLLDAFTGVNSVVGQLTGITNISIENADKDTLAKKWGYNLFAHAHNEVCSRVLDSCFNGIYEGCGTPPTNGRCANGQSTNCPFNYNSHITVDASSGDIDLQERSKNNSLNASAACFGYTSTSGDPYSSLRGPVADARRSIMNKYLLDANADCDLYGEQLRVAAQNISYQKVAAQQALQQKRMEFKQEKENNVLTRAQTAMSNFNQCLSEIFDCYTETEESEKSWPTARIKTYCAQMANIPHCYEEMICTPDGAQFTAVIDGPDLESCNASQDYTQNTCRNVVTLNEILNGAYVGDMSEFKLAYGDGKNMNSVQMREYCLRNAMGITDAGSNVDWNIRNWEKDTTSEE